MRVLIVDHHTKEKVRELVELATANPYSIEQLKALAAGFNPQDPSTRNLRIDKKFTIDLPIGFTVTYTHEYQPLGLCRHISVSVPSAKIPNPVAIQEIMGLRVCETAGED